MSINDTTPSRAPLAAWGAAAIGEVIGLGPRATVHLLEKGALPAKKIGHRWCASYSELADFLKSKPKPAPAD